MDNLLQHSANENTSQETNDENVKIEVMDVNSNENYLTNGFTNVKVEAFESDSRSAQNDFVDEVKVEAIEPVLYSAKNCDLNIKNEYDESKDDIISIENRYLYDSSADPDWSKETQSIDTEKSGVNSNEPLNFVKCEMLVDEESEIYENEHQEKSDTKKYSCAYCSYRGRSKNVLYIHFKRHHDETVEIYQCSQCDFKTKVKPNLKHHYEYKHNISGSDQTKPYLKTYDCTFCNYKSKHKNVLKVHIRLKHDDNVEYLRCDRCSYKTKLKYEFTTHTKYAHNDDIRNEPFKCTYCEYQSIYLKYLKNHVRYKHCTENQFKCHCGFATKYKKSFERHHEGLHGVVAYNCEMSSLDNKNSCNKYNNSSTVKSSDSEQTECKTAVML